ncbi:MAG: PepSY domain-containing protein [Oscillospiraceae bacterium]|nr:PepSY domain-containing protein [Oscillospiraceae bacterium]
MMFTTTKKRGALLLALALAVTLILSLFTISSAARPVTSLTAEQAATAAITNAGLTEAKVTIAEIELYNTQGVSRYGVVFLTDTTRYKYEIDANTGAVLAQYTNAISYRSTDTATYLTMEQALSYALTDAGLTRGAVTVTDVSLDSENGVRVYDLEFLSDTAKYDYEINAVTGAVVKKEVKTIQTATTGTTTGTTTTTGTLITADEAKEIALNHAGVAASNVTKIKAELDRDDGMTIYDVEFKASTGLKYEYEINAATGSIVSFEIDD